MPLHRVVFTPSGRSANVPHGATLADAARLASEPLTMECRGRGACGRCLVLVEEGDVSKHHFRGHEAGRPQVLACQLPVTGALTVRPLAEEKLPRLHTSHDVAGLAPLAQWAPCPVELEPMFDPLDESDLGVAVDIGTTTLRQLLIRLWDGTVLGDASRYNPQIPLGADVISRIVAAERGQLEQLSSMVRSAIAESTEALLSGCGAEPARIRGYVVAGNLTMIHLLLGHDPARIRLVGSEPPCRAFPAVPAASLGWLGADDAAVHTIAAAGAWVGGDILAGVLRAGFVHDQGRVSLYVDLGTNGEIALGGADFALTCACSAGPAFEGGGIVDGMRADLGAVDGARINSETGTMELSVVGHEPVRGICGSGLIALADALFRSGWIDRSGRFTDSVPDRYRHSDDRGEALALCPDGKVALWERDLRSLVRAKAAIFAGIRVLLGSLGIGVTDIDRLVVSGNFGRFLNLPAAVGIGLLPELPPERYAYVDNGSLEGASLMLLSRRLEQQLESYYRRVTYVDLSEFPSYMDEFVGASFFPHTDPSNPRS